MPIRIPDSESDRILVEQMSRGDERALARAYDRFGTLVYSIAYHILGDATDAEEVVAEVFMQVWTSAASFDPARAKVAAWLSVITRSRALDRARTRKRRGRIAEELAQSVPADAQQMPPDLGAEAAELRNRVTRCLADLPLEQRRALELAYYGGFSHSEIAEQLGEPLGTVKTRIRSALSKLRSALQTYSLI